MALESAVTRYFAGGLAEGTQRAYTSAKKRYVGFYQQFGFSPLPLSEEKSCLFAAHLAKQDLSPQTITAYLAAIRHMQIAAGLGAPCT